MQRTILFFVTAAEEGSPGFLSKKGEEFAANACETLTRFFLDSLQIPVEAQIESRAQALLRDPQWQKLATEASWQKGAEAASQLFPELVFLCGIKPATKLTLAPLAEAFALPVTLNWSWDVSLAEIEKGKTGIRDALSQLAEIEIWPKAVVIGCSLSGLAQWIEQEVHQTQGRVDDASRLLSDLKEATFEGVGPAVLGVAMEKDSRSGKVSYAVE